MFLYHSCIVFFFFIIFVFMSIAFFRLSRNMSLFPVNISSVLSLLLWTCLLFCSCFSDSIDFIILWYVWKLSWLTVVTSLNTFLLLVRILLISFLCLPLGEIHVYVPYCIFFFFFTNPYSTIKISHHNKIFTWNLYGWLYIFVKFDSFCNTFFSIWLKFLFYLLCEDNLMLRIAIL